MKQYIDGRYPYERSNISKDYYDQEKVSVDILKRFLIVNGDRLKLISYDGMDLHSVCLTGISSPKEATEKLITFLNIAINWEEENASKRIYLLLDQMDRLFSLSKYYDGDYRIPVPALTYAQPFIPLVTGKIKLKSGSVISAIETTDLLKYELPVVTAIKSCERTSIYDHITEKERNISMCAERFDNYRKLNNLQPIKLVNKKFKIADYPNLYVTDPSVLENMNVKSFHLPSFSKEEIDSLIFLYKSANLIPSNYNYNECFSLKHLTLTNGNGSELFKFITQL